MNQLTSRNGSRSTLLAVEDTEFLLRDEMRAIRFALSTAEKDVVARLRHRSELYSIAREFGRIASERGGAFAPRNRWRDNVIATGGGPGIMEAANLGAADIGASSIGFNITKPHEQAPNPYITPKLSFRFHYFAMRKMHLAIRANALAIFPGD